MLALLATALLLFTCVNAQDNSPCMRVWLTGTGTPPATDRSGPGVLVTYGPKSLDCGAISSTNAALDGVRLQFDVGRSTTQSLTKYTKVTPPTLTAVFLTHIHSDHVIALTDVLHNRWLSTKSDTAFKALPLYVPKFATEPGVGTIGEMCNHALDGLRSPIGADPNSGYSLPEIRLRQIQDSRNADPGANVTSFIPSDTGVETGYSKTYPSTSTLAGTVSVQSVNVEHNIQSPAVGYRVTTPVGIVSISGDTVVLKNSKFGPFAANSSIIVHSIALKKVRDVLYPLCANPNDPASSCAFLLYDRQSRGEDIGDMVASFPTPTPFVMLTHIFNIPGTTATSGANLGFTVKESDYSDSLYTGGYPAANIFGDRNVGKVIVGRDGAMVEIPSKTVVIPDQPCGLWWMSDSSNPWSPSVYGPVNQSVQVRCAAGNVFTCAQQNYATNTYTCSGSQACLSPRTILITGPVSYNNQVVECPADAQSSPTQTAANSGLTITGNAYFFTVGFPTLTLAPAPAARVTCSSGVVLTCPWTGNAESKYSCNPGSNPCTPSTVTVPNGYGGTIYTLTAPSFSKRAVSEFGFGEF